MTLSPETRSYRETIRGFTTIQIGAALGVHPSAVSRYLTRGRNW
jgi:predicted transcriptional regulator